MPPIIWCGSVRLSPAPGLGAIVGAGVRERTGTACRITLRGWTKPLVGGLAGWLGTHNWFTPPFTVFWPLARALSPLLATSIPPAVKRPNFIKSRRDVRLAEISSRRFLPA
jgi:hypothetical protein